MPSTATMNRILRHWAKEKTTASRRVIRMHDERPNHHYQPVGTAKTGFWQDVVTTAVAGEPCSGELHRYPYDRWPPDEVENGTSYGGSYTNRQNADKWMSLSNRRRLFISLVWWDAGDRFIDCTDPTDKKRWHTSQDSRRPEERNREFYQKLNRYEGARTVIIRIWRVAETRVTSPAELRTWGAGAGTAVGQREQI